MAREPSYPKDAPVETPPGQSDAAAASVPGAKGGETNRTRHLVTGAAIGIGSAAIVAALLYANRSKRGDGDKGGNG
jgi:hypothetical protein